MLLASIVPISLLTYLPSDFSAYLALSDLVLESTAYERYYRDKSDLGRLVILDSPVHENVPLDELAWASAVSLVKPSVIVLPDVIDSSDQTVRNALRYASVARRLSPYSQLMGVGHGETTEEFLECSVQLRRTVGVDWLGVSLERRLNDDKLALKRRTERIQALRRNIDTRPAKIHLLGLSLVRNIPVAKSSGEVFSTFITGHLFGRWTHSERTSPTGPHTLTGKRYCNDRNLCRTRNQRR